MKRLLILLSTILMFVGCADPENVKIVKENFNKPEYQVFAFQSGEQDIVIDSGEDHPKNCSWSWGGGKLSSNAYILNSSFMGSYDYCYGCDSCFTLFQNEGLIKYDIIERDIQNNRVRANIQLTDKGRKYLLNEKYMTTWDAQEMKDNNIIYAVMNYDAVTSVDNIYQDEKNSEWYYCDITISTVFTPFAEVFGIHTKDSSRKNVIKSIKVSKWEDGTVIIDEEKNPYL